MVKNIKNKEISPIEGIRKLVKLAYFYHLEENKNCIAIRGLESETDHLPINNSNKLNKEYAEKIKKEEELYLDDIMQLCNNILLEYEK